MQAPCPIGRAVRVARRSISLRGSFRHPEPSRRAKVGCGNVVSAGKGEGPSTFEGASTRCFDHVARNERPSPQKIVPERPLPMPWGAFSYDRADRVPLAAWCCKAGPSQPDHSSCRWQYSLLNRPLVFSRKAIRHESPAQTPVRTTVGSPVQNLAASPYPFELGSGWLWRGGSHPAGSGLYRWGVAGGPARLRPLDDSGGLPASGDGSARVAPCRLCPHHTPASKMGALAAPASGKRHASRLKRKGDGNGMALSFRRACGAFSGG